MNSELYILIGACVFALLIGQQLKRRFKSKEQGKKKQHKITAKPSSRKEKMKKLFLWIQLVLVFSLLLFMIPALSRDLLTNGGNYSQNLILRILIVAFSIYILFTGISKLTKSKLK